MTPNPDSTEVLSKDSGPPPLEKLVAPQAGPRKYQFVYLNMMTHGYWHLSAIYGLYLSFTTAKWATLIFALFIFVISKISVTAGSHRLWAHRSYKAKLPLEILLIIMNSIAFQDTAFTWARDHRLHHRHADTDADPHNSTRGFFYSHIGWLFVKKHPEVVARGKTIPIEDLKKNKLLQFQRKYAFPLMGTLCFFMPTFVPVYFWGESVITAWHINLLRYVCNLNAIFSVNSAAHMFGYKPYDKKIASVQNLPVTFVTLGEGYHNYHHTYPWDYRAAELGNNKYNLTTKFIDFFAWIGWAYDLKTVPEDTIKMRMARSGDGTDLWGLERDELVNGINK